jgi:hypothetical protein
MEDVFEQAGVLAILLQRMVEAPDIDIIHPEVLPIAPDGGWARPSSGDPTINGSLHNFQSGEAS